MANTAEQAHILVVDDEPVVCQSLNVTLRSEGFKVTTLCNGREALDLLCDDSSDFDLVVTDILMPGLSGIDLIMGLEDKGIDLPVMVMTGLPDDDNLSRIRKLGCRHILLKPFDRDSLRCMVSRTLHGVDTGLPQTDQTDVTVPAQPMLENEEVAKDATKVSEACRKGTTDAAHTLPDELSAEPEASPQSTADDHPVSATAENAFSRAAVVNCDVSLEPICIEDPELGAAFVVEAREYFEAVDDQLLTLEREPDNTDALAVIMRAAHTLKGICGFLDIQPIEALAHATEELLETVATGENAFTDELTDLVFHSFDLLKALVSGVDAALSGDQTFHPRPEVLSALRNIADFLQDGASIPTPTIVFDDDRETVDEDATSTTDSASNPTSQRATRVDSDKIDLLLDTIGELVIAEAIVEKDPELFQLESDNTIRNIARLGTITRQLQDLGLAMRMVPIRSTFRKMARLIRDLTRKADRQVDFVADGEDTQIDREMVDKLIEPLVHLLRNAVDHGIESDAEVRRQRGKPEVGTVRLSACHSGGNVQIVVEDDGRGLDRGAIVAKAVERGLIQSGEGLSDAAVFGLIFEPGLSTAAKLTNVSGRGVGMDVVKSQIELLHGKILVDSTAGEGTRFTLVLPLTTAIIDGMVIGVGSQRYILPVLSIIESFKPLAEDVSKVVGRGEIIRFRGMMLPLFRLSGLFHISDAVTDLQDGIVVVVSDSGKQVALLVDHLIGQQQTVIKSLKALQDTTGISDVSIMADGTPGLILDVAGIVRLALNGGGVGANT